MIAPPITALFDDPNLLGAWFAGASWDAWRAILKGAFAQPMTDAEIATFRSLCARDPPRHRVKELWVLAGRRAGKDSVASLIACYAGAFVNYHQWLRPGERAAVMCLAVDRQQAAIVHKYTAAYFSRNALLAPLVERETGTGVELSTGAEIIIATSDYRSVRGRSIACAIFDEVCFWADDRSVSPDVETYNAIVPGTVTLPGSMIVGISTVYAKRGLAYSKWRRYYGKDEDDVLVVQAKTTDLNPTVPESVIKAALDADPARGAAEWMSVWRTDIESYIGQDVIDRCTAVGRFELPPLRANAMAGGYAGFVDPSGGSSDSMTLAIAHAEGDLIVLDAIREERPPFSPEDVARRFSDLLLSYDVTTVTGDRYGGEWPRERFAAHGVAYEPSEKTKSELYQECLPLLTARRVELLDHPRLAAQFVGLERRTARGGRDFIDHMPGAHDDLANVAAGALVAVASGVHSLAMWARL